MPNPSRETTQPRGRPIAVGPAFGGYGVAMVLALVISSTVIVVLGSATLENFDVEDPTPVPLMFAATAAMWAIYVTAAWMLSRHWGTGNPMADYSVRFAWRDVLGVPVGALTQLVIIPLIYWPLMELWPGTFSDDALSEYADDLVERANGIGIVLLVLMVVVGAPLVEELVYRGLLQGALVARFNDAYALVAAAAFFALIHFRPVEYPGLFAAGLVFGASMLVTGRLGTAVCTHLGFNLVGLIIAEW